MLSSNLQISYDDKTQWLVTMDSIPNLDASGAREIAQRLATISGGRVLDVCTGKGKFIGTLMKTLNAFDSFVGIDLSREDLEAARKEFQDQSVQFFEMDATNLEFKDASFDTVSIANSLHHLVDTSKVLTEMLRVLKPRGTIIVEEMYQDGEQSEAQRTAIMEHHWTAKIDRMHGITHHETYLRNELLELLDAIQVTNLELLDSSRYVKCLFCAHRFECENPKSESLVKSLVKGIDKTLDGLKLHERMPELLKESDQIKQRVHETGVLDASIIFAIGVK